MHYLRTRLRPSVHGTVGRSGTGSSPRCVKARRRQLVRGSRLNGTAWGFVITEKFSVPLHELYKWSFNGQALHRCAGALPICTMVGMKHNNCPVPSAPHIAHDIN